MGGKLFCLFDHQHFDRHICGDKFKAELIKQGLFHAVVLDVIFVPFDRQIIISIQAGLVHHGNVFVNRGNVQGSLKVERQTGQISIGAGVSSSASMRSYAWGLAPWWFQSRRVRCLTNERQDFRFARLAPRDHAEFPFHFILQLNPRIAGQVGNKIISALWNIGGNNCPCAVPVILIGLA